MAKISAKTYIIEIKIVIPCSAGGRSEKKPGKNEGEFDVSY